MAGNKDSQAEWQEKINDIQRQLKETRKQLDRVNKGKRFNLSGIKGLQVETDLQRRRRELEAKKEFFRVYQEPELRFSDEKDRLKA